MENKKYDNKFNICIVGNSNVGKSSYIKRITENNFHQSYKKTSRIETHKIHKLIKEKIIYSKSGTSAAARSRNTFQMTSTEPSKALFSH